ncbi:DUF6221 family protein [Rhodococcus sp. IEGM 1330]|uniref:DUF6221 family protein n=1 Tax=Rhodococcus sp. IEGM 1330 TaxID=3082225 RepID=UPI002954ACAB|nr:DUF6221 family protein [Rhodococcus sp. IEGM 1330]MDV8022284.1 DUF6221 family protein [Rhodococcus sp. IEGM 1330]
MNVTEFLEARFDEDEQYVQELLEHEGREAAEGRITIRRWLPAVPGMKHADPWPFPQAPKRLLEEIRAKRAVIAALQDLPAFDPGNDSTDGPRLAEKVLCALAQPYAGHDDFDPDWTRTVLYG